MKTRLLALVLACMMVLSVMPVVVFAEDYCEFSSQVDGDHTLATCPDAEYIKTVPPQCGDRWGYDLFKCPGCSEFFADNFVAPIKDAHALELVEKGTAATCKDTGISAKYECMNMHVDANGNPIKCDYTEGGEVLPKLEHDWQQTGSETGDCESDSQITFKCSLCGETKTEGTKNEHSWITPPAIIEKPYLNEEGVLVNGKATYTCSLCGKTKDVVIIAEHTCTLEKVDAVAATCIAAGNIEYWQCTHPNCGKKYDAETNGNLLTDADIVVAVGAHKLTEVKATPATCNKDTQAIVPGVKAHWNCELCGKNFADAEATTELTDTVDNDGHTWAEDPNVVLPGCNSWGFTFYGCVVCGAIKETDRVEPLGHTTWDDAASTNKIETAVNCQTPGKQTWNCGRCGEAQEQAIPAHTLSKAEFAATCTRYAYSFNYCTVCSNEGQAATVTYKGQVYDLAVNGVVYKIVGEVTFGDALNPENHTWVDGIVNAPTCTEKGDKAKYCSGCGAHTTEVLPAYHSIPQGEPIVNSPANCTDDAFKTYFCAICQQNYNIVEENTKTGHSELVFVITVAPTCSTKGYDVYKCTNEGCTYTENRNETPVVEYVYGTEYSEIDTEDNYFGLVHPNATKVDIWRQGDCSTKGLYRYWCDDCDKYIFVVMPGTGLGHQNDDDYTDSVMVDGVAKNESAAVAPTCTDKGATHAFVCKYCSTFVPATEIDAKGHTMSKVTNVPADKCDIGYWSCSTCNKMYTDAEGKNLINSFVDHDTTWVDLSFLTCEKFQYIHHACKNCGLEYINAYADALGHNWNKTEGKAPTCVEDGVEDLWVCDRDCCDVEGGKIHEENNGEVIPATGIHKNSDGREFTDKCTDTETNRDCVVCKAYIERIHHYGEPIYVDATCVDYGYNLYICVDCMDDKMEKVAEKTDHNWGEWAPVAGNANLEERFCQTDRCDAREERKIADIEYFVEIENALGNVGYTDSSLIAVTIKIKADSPLWGVRLNVKYDENLTFVGAEGISEKLNRNFDANDNNGYVTIAAGASNSTDKKPANVTIEGKEDLAVLYFRVTLPLDETTGLPTVGVAKTTTTITVEPVDASDKDHKALYALGDNETIEILPFMDVNLDGDVNMNDALFMYEILLAVDDDNIATDYEVALDIDKNGAIEYADYVALYRYLVHAWTYEYMTQIGVPAEELA